MVHGERPVTGMHFQRPVVVLDLGRYEAMCAELEKLRRELAQTKEEIDRLGYRFVGAQTSLMIQNSAATFEPEVFVRVPEIRVRAADTVRTHYDRPKTIEEAAMMRAQSREHAVQAAMEHAARTWVRNFHELAERMRYI